MIRSNISYEPLARWTSRLGLFAVSLVILSLLLHRLGMLGSPVALTAVMVAFVSAASAILIGVVAGLSIWVRGRSGAGRTAVGMITGGALWIGAAAALPTYMALPPINDISTDTANPPRFAALTKDRPAGARSTNYPGERTARLQTNAYPDLRSLVVDRSAEEVFEYARLTAAGRKGLGWKVVALEAPSTRPLKPGIIEATTRTTIIGFTDDVIIRVTGSESEARVDVRSASRYGRHDFGANASRVRRFLRELQARLDTSTPGSIIARGGNRAATAKMPLVPGAKRPVERKVDGKARGANVPPAPAKDNRPAKAQPKG